MKKVLISLAVFVFGATPLLALADAAAGLESAASEAGYSQVSYTTVLSYLLSVIVGVLGVLFVILMVYGGVLWMTAAGNSEQVKKAKSLLTNSFIGLVIVILSYAISAYVLDALIRAVTDTPTA